MAKSAEELQHWEGRDFKNGPSPSLGPCLKMERDDPASSPYPHNEALAYIEYLEARVQEADAALGSLIKDYYDTKDNYDVAETGRQSWMGHASRAKIKVNALVVAVEDHVRAINEPHAELLRRIRAIVDE